MTATFQQPGNENGYPDSEKCFQKRLQDIRAIMLMEQLWKL